MNEIIIIDTAQVTAAQFNEMYNMVDRERKQKTDCYIYSQDKITSVVCEICLYYLLSKYDFTSKIVEKNYNKYGKPCLANLPNIYYSISHSKNICVTSLSDENEIGADVECFKHVDEGLSKKMLEKFFSQEDVSLVSSELNNIYKFLILWTQKEALYKAQNKESFTKFLKNPFTKDEVENLRTIKYQEFVLSLFSCNKIDKVQYGDNKFLDSVISRVKKWKSDGRKN